MPDSGQRASAAGFEVTIGSQTITQATGKGVESVTVDDHVDMVDMLTLRMGGAEGQPRWSWKLGDPVEAKLGSCEGTFFEGELTAAEPAWHVEGITDVALRALDRMHRLGRGRKTRIFEDMMDSDVVRQVGGECGLGVQADSTGESHAYILQRNESNIAFLKRLAARNNFMLRVEDGQLVFKKAQFSSGGFALKMGENLRSLRMVFNTVDQVQQVIVRGWDIMAKQEIVGVASQGDIDPIGSGQLGAEIAGQFGESVAYVTDVPVSSQGMADMVARAELNRLARQFARGSATIQGDESVRAGTMVTISGLQEGANGDFFVLASRHVVSVRTGYTTEFTFCSNCFGN